jgi:hypothetical protein
VAGLVFGFGYILGELPNSFAKRRLAIEPGRKGAGVLGVLFFVIDRCDSVIATFLLGALVFSYPIELVLVGVACLTLVHLVVSLLLYYTRIKPSV